VEGIQVNAMTEPVNFTLPKKPKVYAKDPLPDQRKVAVLPIRAITDKRLSHGAFHVLAAICSYCNRAGITWVSQVRLAKDLEITQQAVAKQCKQLRDCGYLETIRKGFKAQRTDTLRVIFDPTVDAETAMAVTSSVEDTRSPQIKQEQAMEEEVDREGQRRVAQAISKALKQPVKRSPTMPKSGETATVRKMKEAIKKAQSKGQQPVDNSGHLQPTGCNENGSYHNPQVVPVNNLQVVHNKDILTRGIQLVKQDVKEVNSNNLLNIQLVNCGLEVLHNQEVDELVAGGLTVAQIGDALETLLPLYSSEGITPSSAILMAGIRQLQADAR
jgi:DNA-binding transcriptional regulator YhcF (GntR family)